MKTLKDAIYDVAHCSKKKLKVIAEEIDMTPNYLTRAALPDPEESGEAAGGSGCNFPLKKVVAITVASGNFAILDYLERRVGRVAIPIPTGSERISDLSRLTLSAVKEFGELMTEVKEGLDDDHISPHELEDIMREGYHAIQSITALIEALKKKADEDK